MSGGLFDARGPAHISLRRRELVVDLFAGGGGASLGIERALGRPVDIAVNHDAAAIAMHAANHPATRHHQEDVWQVDPVTVCGGQPVGFLWASPDCCHFSRAKGGKPVSKKIRSLAWVVCRWAKAVRPRVIALENVGEFQTWGPLKDGKLDPERRGHTFRRFVSRLRNLGYDVDWRILDSADYGAPTRRKRLFLVARCDGEPIAWPAPTHGPKREKPWRAAAECLDWSLPCPSIFERKRPLAEATMRRIAAGLKRYVLEAPEPLLLAHYVERDGQDPRFARADAPLPCDQPAWTVVAKDGTALVAPFLARYNSENSAGSVRGQGIEAPASTLDTQNRLAIVAPHLQQFYGGQVGVDMVSPLPTVTAIDHHGLCAAWLEKTYGAARGADLREPMPTVTAGGQHIAAVLAFLVKYFGACGHGQSCADPLHTITTKARFGLVTIKGVDYQIVDIGLRMLAPRELARAQGLPDDYELTGTKSNQIARIGNSVVPQCAEAVVRANLRQPHAAEALA